MYNYQVIQKDVKTANTTEPVSLKEVKDFSRIDFSTDDEMLKNLIKAARKYCEDLTGISFISKTYKIKVRPADLSILIPVMPVTAVVAVSTVWEEDGTEVLLTKDSDYYEIGGDRLEIRLASLEVGYDILIEVTAGHTTLPDELRMAVLMAVDELYNSRGACGYEITKKYLKQFIICP